jgi:coenzyme F420-reducing hydrogenase beta subunit
VNEDDIARRLFGSVQGIRHDNDLGYYLSTYVGCARQDSFREQGSSGGIISWLASTMLHDHEVDAVIHVRNGADAESMYTYQISHTVEEVRDGAKSKYYPIEMSEILQYVVEHDEKFLFIGIPCFIKAIRLLALNNPVVASRIKYCIGLVCGHLKSDFFAKSEAWESGVTPNRLKSVDFRYKTPGSPASDYAVAIQTTDDGPQIIKRTAELSTTNWGLGYFKYNACDYCDDVLAETADVTFGDAWLPKYVDDANGLNVIVIRNPEIRRLFIKHKQELQLFDSSASEVFKSQAGGFRHRRQGLQYRLHVKKQRGEWVPTKRVQPSLDGLTERRQRIYAMRTVLKDESFKAFHEAQSSGDFSVFNKHMEPFIRQYAWVNMTPKKAIKAVLRRVVPKRLRVALKSMLKR